VARVARVEFEVPQGVDAAVQALLASASIVGEVASYGNLQVLVE